MCLQCKMVAQILKLWCDSVNIPIVELLLSWLSFFHLSSIINDLLFVFCFSGKIIHCCLDANDQQRAPSNRQRPIQNTNLSVNISLPQWIIFFNPNNSASMNDQKARNRGEISFTSHFQRAYENRMVLSSTASKKTLTLNLLNKFLIKNGGWINYEGLS